MEQDERALQRERRWNDIRSVGYLAVAAGTGTMAIITEVQDSGGNTWPLWAIPAGFALVRLGMLRILRP